jgi:hypothetical protein
MIGGLARALDSLLGRGEAAVTVPPLDGALRPNRRLDEAFWRVALPDVDDLAVVSGRLLASAGNTIFRLEGYGWRKVAEYEAGIAAVAALGNDGLAVALETGDIVVEGSEFHARRYRAGPDVRCITAIAASGGDLYVANGSATNPASDWQLDLLERNGSGSVWRIDLATGGSERLVAGLAYPAGLAVDEKGLVYSEAWKHRLCRIDRAYPGKAEVLFADLPGYPGRLAKSSDGHWLSVFAPRSQLVEFVLREPAYRRRMVADVPKPYWVAPKLRSGRSFYEPLQGGGVKHLGLLKPWAPTMSAGLCVKLDGRFQPHFSLHSRADGATHGVTSVAEQDGRIFAAARGDGVVVSIPLDELGDEG